MENRPLMPLVLAGLVAAAVLYLATQPASTQPAAPCPVPCPAPTPAPKPDPKPVCPGPNCPNNPKPKPWGDDSASVEAKGSVVDGREHDGEAIVADLPGKLWMKNIPSKKDGAGMCVMTAIEMAGRYQGVPGVEGLRDWCAREGGGAHPRKVDDQIKRYYATVRKTEPPPYYQYEGNDPGPVLETIDRNGWMACHTYGTSPRYGSGVIHHMVCGPRCHGKFAVVLDSNFVDPPEGSFEWMDPAEDLRRIKTGGQGWVFCWLEPAPPPAPHN